MRGMTTASPRPRVREPQRDGQVVWRVTEDSLPLSHPARVLWEVSGTLDLSAFVARSKSVEGRAGRRNHSVRMLLTLWLYAYSVGVSEAREIERRTHHDFAFRWIVGDMEVCHDRLSRFRKDHRAALNALFSSVLGLLVFKNLISLDTIAVDGTRVRAWAGAASFRSEQGLASCEEHARLHLKAVLAQEERSPAQNARARSAAEEYLQRVLEAKAHLASLQAEQPPQPPEPAGPPPSGPKPRKPAKAPRPPRVSTTDPQARVMKMADGGFRPGMNVELATAGSRFGGARTVVGLLVSNVGSDMGSLVPMADEVQARTGQRPKVILADCNHARYDDIESLRREGIRVLVPEPKHARPQGTEVRHSPELDQWRADVQSAEG